MDVPTTYAGCRSAFVAVAAGSGGVQDAITIPGVGVDGEPLSVDAVRLGPVDARRTLVVMSGVHGVEGPAGSAIQIDRMDAVASALAPDDSALIIHAVNPWGMSWRRRQNEHNVDLNRNWLDPAETSANSAYEELHYLLCPASSEPPDADAFVAALSSYTRERGLDWVRRAVSGGQYSHPDGLYYGGDGHEPSTLALAELIARHTGRPAELTVLDLHTGHGAYGTCTLLSRSPEDSTEGRWIAHTFPGEQIETSAVAQGANVPKSGQLAFGIGDRVASPVARTVTLEIGTRSETRMIVAEMLEHWIHRRGDRSDSIHADLIDQHFWCSTPDDPEWVGAMLAHGRRVVDACLRGAFGSAA